MNVSQFLALSSLALGAGSALADASIDTPLTRAEVVQSVLAARAAGTLRHAGEAGPEEQTPDKLAAAIPSSVTRAEEKTIVRQARAEGALAHAGSVAPEEEIAWARAHPSTSTLTRAEVKAEVLEARAEGTLIPAGQGEYAGVEQTVRMARAAAPKAATLAMRAAD